MHARILLAGNWLISTFNFLVFACTILLCCWFIHAYYSYSYLTKLTLENFRPWHFVMISQLSYEFQLLSAFEFFNMAEKISSTRNSANSWKIRYHFNFCLPLRSNHGNFKIDFSPLFYPLSSLSFQFILTETDNHIQTARLASLLKLSSRLISLMNPDNLS